MRRMRPLITLSLAGLMALSACGEDVAAKNDSTGESSATGGSNNSAPAKVRLFRPTPTRPAAETSSTPSPHASSTTTPTPPSQRWTSPSPSRPRTTRTSPLKSNRDTSSPMAPRSRLETSSTVGTGPPTDPTPSSPATSSSQSRVTPTNSVVTRLVRPSPRLSP